MARFRELAVWMNGHLVGYWSVSAGDSSFVYEESWLKKWRAGGAPAVHLRGK